MGVLKVWDGTDWRKVGCGDGGLPVAATYLFEFELRPDLDDGLDSTTCSLHWYDGTSEHLVGTYTGPAGPTGVLNWTPVSADVSAYVVQGVTNEARLRYYSGLDTSHFRRMRLLADGVVTSYGQYPLGFDYTAAIQNGDATGRPSTNYELAEQGSGDTNQWDAQVAANVGGLSFVRLYFPTTSAGRLRLWTGSGWVREACSDDSHDNAHPLKIEDPTSPGTWITVACMVPEGDVYDSGLYDTAVYG